MGALFRHFETMGDFMAATAYEVMRRQLDEFSKKVAEIPADEMVLEAALTILRDLTANATNTVMYELMVAARTDEKLKDTLQIVLEQYSSRIYDAARALPGADGIPEDVFPALVAMMANTFDGAALVRAVLPQPEIEAQRIGLLVALLNEMYAIDTVPD